MEELLGHAISVLRGMWRHRWPGMAVAWFVSAVGMAYVLSIPDQYQASARIFVDTQSILKPLMSGLAVQPNVDQQVAMLSRTLISRPNVEKLIRMADLDLAASSKGDQEKLISRLMATLSIRNAGRDNLYTLSYRDPSQDKAKRVVQSLVSIFVESSLGQTRTDSASAKKFIDEQIRNYVTKLEDAEMRLKQFKLRNIDLQNAEGKDSTFRLSDVKSKLNQARLELSEAENARDSARSQLADEKSQTANVTSRSILQQSAVSVSTPELDARIAAQKQSLDGLLQRYTDLHPDVINARRLIKTLEEQRAQEVIELRKVAMANPTPANGVTESLIAQELGRMLANAEVRVASLKARVAEFESRQVSALAALKTAPQIEAEYAQLNREYGIHKANYESLVSRRESATLSGELEGSSGMAEFRLIDPPRATPKPVAPNRLLLLPGALVAALAAGCGIAFLLSQLRSVFFDARAVRNTIGLPVLGVVTLVQSDASGRRERRDLKWFSLSLVMLIGVFAALILGLSIMANRIS